MWTWVLLQAKTLNLIVSVCMFFGCLIFAFLAKPRILTHKFAQWCLGAWTAQWFIWTIVYWVLGRHPSDQLALLLLLDLQATVLIASAWILLEGDHFHLPTILVGSGILYVVMLLWALVFAPQDPKLASVDQLVLWVSFSQTIAALGMPIMGLVFFMRYHVYGAPFFIVTVGYGGAQVMAYSLTFVGNPGFRSEGILFLALALGKLLIAALFFGMLVLLLSRYDSLAPALDPNDENTVRADLGRAFTWIAITFFVPLISAGLIALGKRLFRG